MSKYSDQRKIETQAECDEFKLENHNHHQSSQYPVVHEASSLRIDCQF